MFFLNLALEMTVILCVGALAALVVSPCLGLGIFAKALRVILFLFLLGGD